MSRHLPCVIWLGAALTAAATTSHGVAAAEAKVHLFILSGQSNMAGLDPNVSFTPALKRTYANDEVIVVKHAIGAQPILRWYKAVKLPQRIKLSENQKPGDIYDELMAQVAKAVGGKKANTITFVWMQGERDAGTGWSSVYADNLRGLLKQLRDDFKRPDVTVVIGRLSDFGKGNPPWEAVREAQEKVAGEDPLAALVDTDDLNGDKNGKHYTREGYAELGRRFAAKAIELINKQGSAGKHPGGACR
jgi:hypothetical protein